MIPGLNCLRQNCCCIASYSIMQSVKGLLRSTYILYIFMILYLCSKNLIHSYSDIQAHVREATSNDATGPTMGQMELISTASFSS